MKDQGQGFRERSEAYFTWLIVVIQKPIHWVMSLFGHHLGRKQVITRYVLETVGRLKNFKIKITATFWEQFRRDKPKLSLL